MVNDALISQVKMLSIAECIELIGAVWKTLPSNEAPISEEEKFMLDAGLTEKAFSRWIYCEPGHLFLPHESSPC